MKYFKTIILLLLMITISSCNNIDDNTPPDCGCESETITRINESDDLVAEMYYKIQTDDPMDTYYNDYFWIVYTAENCINCVNSMIVCNEEFLGGQFDTIKETGEIVEIKFSGELKTICELPVAFPADYTYRRITPTSIERL